MNNAETQKSHIGDEKKWLRQLIRCILPNIIRHPLADRVYQFVSYGHKKITALVRYYEFLCSQKHQLTWWEHWSCQILRIAIYILEKRFLKEYQNFSEALDVNPSTMFTKGHGLLCVISTLGPGGAERQAVLTLTQLQQRNLFQISLCVFFLDSQSQRFYLDKVEEAQISIQEFDRDSKYQSLDIEKAYRVAQCLPQALRSDVMACIRSIGIRRPEVVHIWLDETNIKSGLAAVALGIPKIILSTRNLPPFHFGFYQLYMREGYRWLLQQPGVTILNNSLAGARAYEKWLKLPKGSIRVIHNGFHFDDAVIQAHRDNRSRYRNQNHIPVHALVVGTMIRLSDEKRPLLWLETVALVRKEIPEVQFLMVGDGPLRLQVEKRIVELQLETSLHLVRCEKEALTAIAAMDVFLLTSRVEGLPNVLIEAQAVGIPVITTNAGGARETFAHGITGWVVDSHDASVIAKRVIQTVKNKNWCQKASPKGLQFVKEHFSVQHMVKETLEIYNLKP